MRILARIFVIYLDDARQFWTSLDTSFARILASVYGLDRSEAIMTQWVFLMPAHIERLNSSALADRRYRAFPSSSRAPPISSGALTALSPVQGKTSK